MVAPERFTPTTPGRRVVMKSDMTLRDAFALSIAGGLATQSGIMYADRAVTEQIAFRAYTLADALLAARTTEGPAK